MLKEAAQIMKNTMIPIILDFGVAVMPMAGYLAPFCYQIMPLIQGKPLPVVLNSMLERGECNVHYDKIFTSFADKCLVAMCRVICEYFKNGYLVGHDIHVENILFDGADFSLVDAGIAEANEDDLEDVLRSLLVVAMQIQHWDQIGLAVSAFIRGTDNIGWLDDFDALRELPRTLPASSLDCCEVMVKSMGSEAWPGI